MFHSPRFPRRRRHRGQPQAAALVLLALVTGWVSPLLALSQCACRAAATVEGTAAGTAIANERTESADQCCQIHAVPCGPAARGSSACELTAPDGDQPRIVSAGCCEHCDCGPVRCEGCGSDCSSGCQCRVAELTRPEPFTRQKSASERVWVEPILVDRVPVWTSTPSPRYALVEARCDASPLLWDAQTQYQRWLE